MLTQLIARFAPITLEEMSGIKLMNRIDTKFVTTRGRLMLLLQMAQPEYFVQQTAGERNIPYSTTYWDTGDFDMYRVHQSGHCGRQKLRFRTYVSSDLQFMEVKTKNNHGRTKKKRMQVGDMNLDDTEKLGFLARHLRYEPQTLRPAIHNEFHRITLVNHARTERLTIDNQLRFHNLVSGQERDMGDLIIIELKRDGLCYSPVLEMLRRLRIMPHGFSKYCMGSAMTNPQLPVNRFKPKLRDVERILARG
ncbi:MAG: polyphosphate polymerase domain-containing protein [Prevotella sp.]|nr:polyphosphate polymerase domain-containing protein [Prevotella sp.]